MDLIYYNGEHSVTIGDKHSWMDWRLIPTSKPVISVPTVKTKSINIPGTNGSLDLTSVLTGYPLFSNRQGQIGFIVDSAAWKWEEAFSDIAGYLAGKRYRMVLDDDPEWYYEGQFWVSAVQSDKSMNVITVNYDLYPYKRKPAVAETVTLSNTPTIYTIENHFEPSAVTINPNRQTLQCTMTAYGTLGQVIANGGITVATAGSTTPVSLPANSRSAVKYVLQMTGSGAVIINYQEGRL